MPTGLPQPDPLAERLARAEESIAFAEHESAQLRKTVEELSRQLRDLHALAQRLQRRIDAMPSTPDADAPDQPSTDE